MQATDEHLYKQPVDRRQVAGTTSAGKPKRQQQILKLALEDVADSVHVYNAIRLTNYYTNLLSSNRLNDRQRKYLNAPQNPTGESWRSSQLAHQIPHQDIKMLAEFNQPPVESGPGVNPISDEIKFIRKQRKLASQFKASLYYLNPIRPASASTSTPAPTPANGKTSSWLRKVRKSTTSASQESNGRLDSSFSNENEQCNPTSADSCCFKCKRPIELGSTCVRVDNLQMHTAQDGANLTSQTGATTTTTMPSKTTTEQRKQMAADRKAQQTADSKPAHANEDEGLGTGSSSSSSSAHSSTAGSHCDDRETPPHVATVDGGQPISVCDNNSPSMEDERLGSSQRSSKLLGRKMSRALTWSASLNSLGAKLSGQSSQSGSQSKSRSESDLEATTGGSSQSQRGEDAIGGHRPAEESLVESKTIDGASGGSDEPDSGSILFHTDCFSCSTCSELLVDLRALIYVNEPSRLVSSSQSRPSSKNKSEYVNLDADEDNDGRQAVDQQQISLFCHRHFVELFKPRCQQCDCLILDEECTEAEGKVWHIKHFCCTECRVPLGGHQYIIVDQTVHSSKLLAMAKQPGTGAARTREQQQNSPYCLRCFDCVFGETCDECGKLIACDSGAINHESRCWHASPTCFRCHQCRRSLLGSPFLPTADGKIYCSLQCSSEQQQQTCNASNNNFINPKMSLANYWDPRASLPTSTTANGKQTTQQQQPLNPEALMRHKPLIDYLLASARSDETSRQLLSYLHGHLAPKINPPSHADATGRALIDQIGRTLDQIESAGPKQQTTREHAAGAKLPAPLSSQVGGMESQQQQQVEEELLAARRNKLNPFLIEYSAKGAAPSSVTDAMMSMMMDALAGRETKGAICNNSSSNNTTNSKILGGANYMNLDCCLSLASSSPSQQVGGVDKQQLKHSAANGQSKAEAADTGTNLPAYLNQQRQFKASQCSPVASLISNEGTISDHSASTSSGVSSSGNGPNAAGQNAKSHSPLSSTSSHSSVGSTSGGPAVSVALNSSGLSATNTRLSQARGGISAAAERRRRVQPITELSVVDLLAVADDKMQQKDGFDRLVDHFESQRARPNSSKSGSQSESFFFELAQRLPKRANASSHDVSSYFSQPAPSQPLDTNGLPEVPPKATISITDHYSTVNKANKSQQHQQQQVADEAGSGQFFSIVAPLMNYPTDSAAGMRPTSSLSVLDPGSSAGAQQPPRQQVSRAAFSTGSIRPNSSLGQASTSQEQKLAPKAQAPKQTKSVSFDPTVKDPPTSASMTLGRASGLKSALKASSNWAQYGWQQQQQFDRVDHFAASSATMPSELASQLRAGTSLSAFNAYYDEMGRRVRLSSLVRPDEQQQQLTGKSGSILSGAISKLTGQSSRGGRREERKLLQQQQQPLTIQTSQPMSLFQEQQMFKVPGAQMNLPPEAMVQPQFNLPTQPTASSSAGVAMEQPVDEHAPKSRRHRTRHSASSSRRRSSRSHRSSRHRRKSPHRRRRATFASARSSRRHRRVSTSSSSRYCDSETECYDSDASSRCSTCSSSSSGRSSSSSDGSSSASYSDSEYDDRDSDSVASYTSYSNTNTSAEEDDVNGSSRSSSPYSSRSPSPMASRRSHRRKHRRRSGGRASSRRATRRSSGGPRSSSIGAGRSSHSKSSSSTRSRSSNDSSGPRSEGRRTSNPSSRSRHRSSGGHHSRQARNRASSPTHSSHGSQTSHQLNPARQQQPANVNFYDPAAALINQQQQQQQQQFQTRAQSPSAISTKSASAENCRII